MAPKRSGGSLGGDKKRGRDDLSVKCEEITSALKAAESLPEALREMLSTGVEVALIRFKDERHPYQAAVVTWVEEALGSIQVSLEQSLAESKATVDGAEAEKAKLQAIVSSAQENKAKSQDAMVDAEVRSSNLTVEVEEKMQAFREAKEAEENAVTEAEAVAGKKVELEALLAPDGQFSKWGSEAPEKKEANAFVKMLKSKSKFEPLLLQSLLHPLVVVPEARTDFDKLVLQHFRQAVEKDIAAQAGILDMAASTRAQRADVVAAAQSEVDAAEVGAEAGVAAAAEAAAAGKRAVAEAKAAETSSREYGPAVKAAYIDYKSTQTELEDFKSGPLATLIEMRDRMGPVDDRKSYDTDVVDEPADALATTGVMAEA